MHNPHITRTFMIALALIATLCIGLGSMAWWLRPPSFSTRKQAIIYILEQRGYQVEELYIDRRWPDSVNSQVYGASLDIQIHGQSRLSGRVECRNMQDTCHISIRTLGLNRVPIPDLSTAQEPELLQWVRQQASKLVHIQQ